MTSDTYDKGEPPVTSSAHHKPETTTKPQRKSRRKPAARVFRSTDAANGGQPTKPGSRSLWKPHYVKVCKRLASAGLTDEEMAAHLGVGATTFDDWKARYPELLKVLKVGKEIADERVVRSLYRRALGYSVTAQKPFVDKFGVEHVVDHVEHVEPDVVAGIFWLKNRRPEEWRDRINVDVRGIPTPDDMRRVRNRLEAEDRDREAKGLPALDRRPTYNAWGGKIDWDGVEAITAPKPVEMSPWDIALRPDTRLLEFTPAIASPVPGISTEGDSDL